MTVPNRLYVTIWTVHTQNPSSCELRRTLYHCRCSFRVVIQYLYSIRTGKQQQQQQTNFVTQTESRKRKIEWPHGDTTFRNRFKRQSTWTGVTRENLWGRTIFLYRSSLWIRSGEITSLSFSKFLHFCGSPLSLGKDWCASTRVGWLRKISSTWEGAHL